MSKANNIMLGDRVLYRYSPAGEVVYGVVTLVKRGELHVRTNLLTSEGRALILVRNLESWQLLSDNSKLHKNFRLQSYAGFSKWVIAKHCLRSVPPVILDKLLRT